jgi:hypothetical protein
MLFFFPILFLIKALIIFSWVDSGPLSVGEYEFPKWSEVLGNIISAASIVGAVIWAIYMVIDAMYINKRVR